MGRSNILFVTSKEELANPSGPLAFPHEFARIVGDIYERERAAKERTETTNTLMHESLSATCAEVHARSLALLGE